MTGNLKYK
jgi:hypothetical protein